MILMKTFSEDFKPLQQTVSLSHFNNRHSLVTSEDDFSDDSLENSPPQQDTSTEIIEIKLETKEAKAAAEEEEGEEEIKVEETEEIASPSPEQPQMPPLTLPLNKCSPGIAWEIKLDDNIELDKQMKVRH